MASREGLNREESALLRPYVVRAQSAKLHISLAFFARCNDLCHVTLMRILPGWIFELTGLEHKRVQRRFHRVQDGDT